MAIVKWMAVVLSVSALLLLLAGRFGLLHGSPPTDLGVHDGRLKPPSTRPNSVSSQAALYPEHPQRAQAQIEPLGVAGDAAATLARLKSVVQTMEGARIVKTEPDYLYAQFTTKLMQFVDDCEFWFDPSTQTIQLRCASRIGYSDRGVNRARVETIRQRLSAR